MPDRVLVTGATGFVGSHLAQAFVEAGGYEVRVGARASSNERWISSLDTERVLLDLDGSAEDLSRAVHNVDVVVHAAGITRARRPEQSSSLGGRCLPSGCGCRSRSSSACWRAR